jgi:hypothetical protein
MFTFSGKVSFGVTLMLCRIFKNNLKIKSQIDAKLNNTLNSSQSHFGTRRTNYFSFGLEKKIKTN